jgi:hypothetical protein
MQGVHACCDLREVVQVVESESDHYICIAFACIAKHFVFAGLRQPLGSCLVVNVEIDLAGRYCPSEIS